MCVQSHYRRFNLGHTKCLLEQLVYGDSRGTTLVYSLQDHFSDRKFLKLKNAKI